MTDLQKIRELQGKVMKDIAAGALIPIMMIGDELNLFEKLYKLGPISSKDFSKKIEQGVNFFQTQYAFDAQILKKYMDRLKKFNITKKAYYLVGLGVIKSAKSAKWMNKNLFGINIPDSIIQRLEDSTNESKEGIKICIELIEKYQEIEGVHGIHLMGYHQEEQIAEVISHFKK